MRLTAKVLVGTAMLILAATAVLAETMSVKRIDVPVSALDWSVANALAVKENKIANHQVGSTFTMYDQAIMEHFLDAKGNPIGVAGLNDQCQYAVVAGFGEITNTVTSYTNKRRGIEGTTIMTQIDGDSAPDPLIVPEPSTMVVIGANLFGLCVFARRKREK